MPKKQDLKTMIDGKLIKRNYDFTQTQIENGNEVSGHAAVFEQSTDIGGWFAEIIARGAFDKTDLSDVALFLNHDTSKIPLARSRKGNSNSSMKVSVDAQGLFMQATLDAEKNSDARNLISAIERGDISGMSFMFLVDEEDWTNLDTDYPTRRILSISKVFEVSAVTWPAYDGTSISARSDSLESDRVALERAKNVLYIDDNNQIELEKQRLLLRSLI